MKTLRIATLLLGAFFLFGNAALTDAAWAEDKPDTDLAKQSQNPVSDLISVPFENNLNFTAGTEDAYVNVLNVKPVLPVRIAENWNLINRAIIPIVYQGERFPGVSSAWEISRTKASYRRQNLESSSGAWAPLSSCPPGVMDE